jgi:membrane-bound lytic murein transglycosylase A
MDDHGSAFATFAASCRAMAGSQPVLRAGKAPSAGLLRVCRDIAGFAPANSEAARAFFESRFVAWKIIPPDAGQGFLTGYYEPLIEGSLVKSDSFPHPIYRRPPDLVTIEPGSVQGLPSHLSAARRIDGGFAPFPDRADIEAGALAGAGLELVYLRDEVEAFFVHVQGSARINLTDGRQLRLTYAGRNGHAYTSIGQMVVAERHMTRDEMSLARFKAWLRANPSDARRIMRANRSFIFFDATNKLAPDEGPIGGAGVSLTAGRSLAVDRTIWSYGSPFYLAGKIPGSSDADIPLARLMIAQDTGSAILGPARGDFYFGTGEEAGRRAGLTRHATDFYVLLPAGEDAR